MHCLYGKIKNAQTYHHPLFYIIIILNKLRQLFLHFHTLLIHLQRNIVMLRSFAQSKLLIFIKGGHPD